MHSFYSKIASVLVILLVIVGTGAYFYFISAKSQSSSIESKTETDQEESEEFVVAAENEGGPEAHPLMIEEMRKLSYPGSDLVTEETLPNGSNYKRFLASYQSEGLKINGLLTIPMSEKPAGGFPAIIFNHGYIPPEVYRPTERYIAYVDNFARSGYIVFRPDYRGHADSEGTPEGAYYSPGYTVDVLNALASVKKHTDVNPQKIGMWGHSLGGFITQKSMVLSKDIKVGVVWGGVVGTYEDMYKYWWSKRRSNLSPSPNAARRPSRQQFINLYGEPTNEDKSFWYRISAANYLSDISGPIQIHHTKGDETVPWELSESLKIHLEQAGKEHEYYIYEGGDHDISDPHFSTAMQRSIEYFNKYLKN